MGNLLHFVEHQGPAEAAPLLIAHGLLGSSRNWNAIARRLAAGRRVLVVDMRNHGDSFHSDTHDYPAMADDLAQIVQVMGGRVDVLGHSMGGKAAMAMALLHRDLVRRLIVADIAPVTYTHSHRPSIETMQHVDLTQVTSRADADRQMAASMADAVQRAFLIQNLVVAEDGSRWKANLAALSRNHDAILSFPEIDGQFDGPALFLSGELSDYVAERHAGGIRAKFPGARFQTIAGAGHWLHADKPEAFIAAVSAFLQG